MKEASRWVYRYTNNPYTPFNSGVGFTMWSDEPERFGDYGWRLNVSGATHIVDIQDIVRDKLISQYEEGTLHPSIEEIINPDTPYETIDSIVEEFNPTNIGDSAEAWDNLDMVQWFWEEIAEPNGIDIVETYDGAIAFNPDEDKVERFDIDNEFDI